MIYFIGICGTAMGNGALLMRELGYDVVGSDENVYPPMSDLLAASVASRYACGVEYVRSSVMVKQLRRGRERFNA